MGGRTLVREALAGTALFAGLTPAALDDLEAAGSSVALRAGSCLFGQGDAGDCLYVVRSGLLEAVVSDGSTSTAIRSVRRGGVVGELAVICDAPRSASVSAVRDSELWRIDRARVHTLLRTSPDFAASLVRLLGERLRTAPLPTAPPPGRLPSVIAILAASRLDPEPICRALAAVAPVVRMNESGDPRSWPGRVEAAEGEGATVVLVAPAGREGDGDRWRDFCVRQADRVIVVADAGTDPGEGVAGAPGNRCDLVLRGSAGPFAVGRWIDVLAPRSHHFVDAAMRDGAALARIARRVTGRAVGLVLSGGGARGFAHIGVLQALEDAGVAVDRIGGTSMGAFVGALAARGMSPAQIVQTCRTEFVDRKPFNDYTAPRVSLVRGRKARAMLHRLHGDTHIEELPIGFFSVSADLLRADAVAHRRGPLDEALAASMSLPGLAPPVNRDGRILVDGGVLQNLPVQLMNEDDEGPVVAVDVTAQGASPSRGNGTHRKSAQTLPSIVETLARATMLGSRQVTKENLASAHMAIRPPVHDVGLFEFARLDALVATGRRAAERALESGAPALRM